MRTKQLFLATGSNLGDRAAHLAAANARIAQHIGAIVKASAVYETQAWGLEDQPDFLNQVLEVATLLTPEQVLHQVKQIEQQLGRERLVKWGERIIDIDILFYEQLVINEANLKVPHPFLQDRNFVLVPLHEIAPDFVHPVLGLSIAQLLNHSKDPLSVKVLNE